MTELERFVKRLVDVLEGRDPAGVHRPLSIGDLRGAILPYRQHRAAIGLTNNEDYELLVLRLIAEEGGFVKTYPPESAELARTEVGHPNPDLDLVEMLADTTVQIGAAGLARIQTLAQETEATTARPSGRMPSPLAGLPLVADEPAPPEEPAAPAEISDTWAPPRAESAAAEPPPAPVAEEPASERIEAPPEAPELFEPIADSISVDEFPAAAVPTEPGPPPVAAPCPACSRALPTHREAIFCPHCGVRLGVARCPRCSGEIEPGWRHCIVCGHQTGAGAFA